MIGIHDDRFKRRRFFSSFFSSFPFFPGSVVHTAEQSSDYSLLFCEKKSDVRYI